MPKVHPKCKADTDPGTSSVIGGDDSVNPPSAVVLTVWKKSLLFNCDGFTVFDGNGNLRYRVDQYISGRNAEISLMDSSGKSLLTIRRKKLSLVDNWLVFDGETADSPVYVVKKNFNLLTTKCVITSSSKNTVENSDAKVLYEAEGSSRRCSAVYDGRRRLVAEVKMKESAVKGVTLGTDVFNLVVHPSLIDMSLAMAIVILLD